MLIAVWSLLLGPGIVVACDAGLVNETATMLMRDTQEGRKKQARSDKQHLQTVSVTVMYMLMRDEKEGRKKQARSSK